MCIIIVRFRVLMLVAYKIIKYIKIEFRYLFPIVPPSYIKYICPSLADLH